MEHCIIYSHFNMAFLFIVGCEKADIYFTNNYAFDLIEKCFIVGATDHPKVEKLM